MAFAGGTGVLGDPYLIASVADLQAIDVLGYRDKHYLLTADIDVSSVSPWIAICDSTYNFTGVFDGNGKTISGMSVRGDTARGAGFFGYINGATVKNLTIVSPSLIVPGSTVTFAGFVCAHATNSVIEACTVNMSAFVGTPYGYIGGICGYAVSGTEITNCAVEANITGNITPTYAGYTGGIVASTYLARIAHCSVTGTLEGLNVGGIIATSVDSELEECYSEAAINYANGQSSGGLVGQFYSSQNALSTDIVRVKNCYAIGDITNLTTSASRVGGLIGGVSVHELSKAVPTIEHCYSAGAVNNPVGAPYANGFLGSNENYSTEATVFSSCYYDSQTSGKSDTGFATPKTTAQMKTQATFVDWNFDTVWGIEEGVTYPNFEPSPTPPETVVLAERDLLVRYQNNGSGKWSDWRKANLGERGDTVLVRSIKRLGCYKTRKYQLVWFASVPIAISVLEERARLGGENGQS